MKGARTTNTSTLTPMNPASRNQKERSGALPATAAAVYSPVVMAAIVPSHHRLFGNSGTKRSSVPLVQ
jgi:hypothetical protein